MKKEVLQPFIISFIVKLSECCFPFSGFKYVLVGVIFFSNILIFRYHARDASVIREEQELQREFGHLDRQCQPCTETPRLLWGYYQEEDMNDVPCCDDTENIIDEKIEIEELGPKLRSINLNKVSDGYF